VQIIFVETSDRKQLGCWTCLFCHCFSVVLHATTVPYVWKIVAIIWQNLSG